MLQTEVLHKIDTMTTTMTLYQPVKKIEKFPLKQIIFNWNSLRLELKATADPLEFEILLKRYYLS